MICGFIILVLSLAVSMNAFGPSHSNVFESLVFHFHWISRKVLFMLTWSSHHRQNTFNRPLPTKSLRKYTFRASRFKTLAFMHRYGSFYDRFRVLCTKCVAIEHGLKAKPRGWTFTNQGLRFGRDIWMSSVLIHGSANLLEII